MTTDISFDLVMEDDMSFIEGTYRLKDGDWQVFIISKAPVEVAQTKSSCWSSGVTGVAIHLPCSVQLNKQTVKKILSEWLEIAEWREVRGPDSMQLR